MAELSTSEFSRYHYKELHRIVKALQGCSDICPAEYLFLERIIELTTLAQGARYGQESD